VTRVLNHDSDRLKPGVARRATEERFMNKNPLMKRYKKGVVTEQPI
jgi:hypothetical protein